MFGDAMHFRVQNGNLYGIDNKPYILKASSSEDLAKMQAYSEDEKARVFADEKISESDLNALGSYQVTDEFYRWLASLEKWDFAKGRFETAMARRMAE